MPSLLGGQRGKGPGWGWGGDQRLFEKIKVFFKNQKHEPNIVEITHLCIMHRVHTSIVKWLKTDTNKLEHKKKTRGISLTKDFHMYVIMNPFNANILNKNM
jgi:hypothetical protein